MQTINAPETIVWRLVKHRHIATAFDGEGARLYGGRWNSRGTPMVYLSASLSLAALELFVHLSAEDARLQLAAIPVSLPAGIAIDQANIKDLPKGWRSEPPTDACKAFGSDWANAGGNADTNAGAKSGGAALLRIPSVIVPREFNYLANPRHPAFAQLTPQTAEPFGFDDRMWK